MKKLDKYFEKRNDGKDYLSKPGIIEAKKIYEKYSDKDIRNLARISKNSLLNWISEKAISRTGMNAIKSLFIRNLQADEEIAVIKEDLSRFTTEELLDELINRGYNIPFYNPMRTISDNGNVLDNDKSKNTTSVWQEKHKNDMLKQLETKRLMLDIPEFFDDKSKKIFTKDEIESYIGRKTDDCAFEHYRLFLNHSKDKLNWSLIDKKNRNNILGFFILYDINPKLKTGKISFIVAEKYKRKGYMTEASSTILAYLFEELKFRMVSASCHEKNIPSQGLLTKAGFKMKNKGKVGSHISYGKGSEFQYVLSSKDWMKK